ncbi:hypothetical protein, partial [Sinorhizobium medicae]
ICSSVNLCFFMRPSFNRPDSNPNWRKLPVAGQHCRARRRRCRRGALAAGDPGGAVGMIPSGVKVFLASHPVDFRKGPDSLLSLVRISLNWDSGFRKSRTPMECTPQLRHIK